MTRSTQEQEQEQEQDVANSSFGTWEHNGNRITAAYFDAGEVRINNSAGEVWFEPNRKWLERWDALRDDGWTRVA